MQRQVIQVHLLLLILLQEAYTFLPNHFSSLPNPDDLTHADITEIGILRAVAEYLETVPASGHTSLPARHSLTGIPDITTKKLFDAYYGNGVCDIRFKEAMADIVKYNNKAHLDHRHEASWQFNGEQIKEANEQLQLLRDTTIKILSAQEPNYDAAREVIGQYLHVLQMFYSNTNWIELYGDKIYKDLGMRGRSLMPISTRDQDTCRGCGYVRETCFNNLLDIGPVLTSGYKSSQNVRKPQRDPALHKTGKCSHGGVDDESASTTPTGGINKESGNPSLSPHFHLHLSAASAAIKHTKSFFVDQHDGLLAVIGQDKFRDLLQLQPGTYVVFVVDSAFPNEDEAKATKEKIREIIMETYGTTFQPYEYTLVSFGDKDSDSEVTRTKNAKQMIERIESIPVAELDDTSFISFVKKDNKLGMLTTAKVHVDTNPKAKPFWKSATIAHPYSRLLIFARTTLTNDENVDYITRLITAKHLTVDFIITGSTREYVSNDRTKANGYHNIMKRAIQTWKIPAAFTNIATISGGHVYQSSKTDISNTVNVLKNSLSTSEVAIMRLHVSGGNAGFSVINLPVDETMTELRVSIDGITAPPSFKLLEPAGNIVFPGTYANTSFEVIGSYVVVVVRSPTAGKWSLQRTNTLTWEVDVRGQSTLDFTSKLMKTTSDGFTNYEISGRPIAGDNLTITVTINDFTRLNQVDQLLLLDEKGQMIDNVKLTNISSKRNRGVLKCNEVIPVDKFQLAIDGYDKSGFAFRRLHPTMISPVAIKLETRPLSGPLYINSNLQVPYSVTNLGSGLTEIVVEMKDDKGFTVAPNSVKHVLAANAIANGSLLLHAGSTIGETTTITLSAKPSFVNDANSQYVILHITTENGTAPVDTTPPVCNLGTVTGSCASKPLCDCNITYATAEAELWDEGLGLKDIISNGTGTDFNFTVSPFTPGLIKSVGTAKAHLRINCCRKEAYIVVTDLNGNTSQCVVPVNSNWKPNGCVTTTTPATTSTVAITSDASSVASTQTSDSTTAAITNTVGSTTTGTGQTTSNSGSQATTKAITSVTVKTTTNGGTGTGSGSTVSSTGNASNSNATHTNGTTTAQNSSNSSASSSGGLSTTTKALIGAGAGTFGLAAIVTGAILLKKKYSSVSPD